MNLITKYGAIFKMGLSDAIEYRFNFFTQVLLWYFPLVIQILLWSVVYKSFRNSTIAGYSLNGMITYYFIVMIVNELVKTEGIEWSVISDIRDGNLQRYLIQPIDFLTFKLVYVFSKKLLVIVCIIINLIPMTLFFHKLIQFHIIPLNILYFCISLLFSLMIFYFIQTTIAMFSFWFTEFSSIFHFLPFVFSVLNGTAFPLNILPGWLITVLSYTPFYYTVYFPTQIFAGNLDEAIIAQCFLLQTFWLLFCFVLCKIVWSKGIQHFSASGG
jgi:ABC-2 type transport system permease protein